MITRRPLPLALGSPPQAWGRPSAASSASVMLRFTPTGVGTASGAPLDDQPPPVHPHRRGDGTVPQAPRLLHHGSPPQAWGRQPARSRGSLAVRFTPTGVGTAACAWAARCCSPVHPHRRGDGGIEGDRAGVPGGSPPQAWGRRRGRRWGCPVHRFTPTGVGTAQHSAARSPARTVHPHRRGDGGHRRRERHLTNGSPPQAWGRHVPRLKPLYAARFTPTGVGTAVPRGNTRRPYSVHPHRRGDGFEALHRLTKLPGSPPQAWGRPIDFPQLFSSVRFTPTGVGTATRSRDG